MYKAKGGVFYFFHTQYNVYANALSQDHDKEYFYVYEPNSQKWERFFPDFREFKRAPMPDELRNFLFTVVDYIIPIESGYILITGKNFEGEERSRLVAGTSLVIEAGLTFTVVGKGFYKAGKGVLKAAKNATSAIVKSKKVLKGSAKELEVATEVVVKNADKVVKREIWNGVKNIFKATADEVAEAAQKVKNYRATNKVKGGNVGYIEGTIDGKIVDNKMWRSVPLDIAENEIHIFNAIKAANSKGREWLRITDSEYRMLNDLAQDLGAKRGEVYSAIKGEIKIISELEYCKSCTGIIQQFNEMFPNIKLILVDGVK